MALGKPNRRRKLPRLWAKTKSQPEQAPMFGLTLPLLGPSAKPSLNPPHIAAVYFSVLVGLAYYYVEEVERRRVEGYSTLC